MANKGRAVPGLRLAASALIVAYDPGNIAAAGGVATTTVAVPQAKVGDNVIVTPDTITDGAVWQGRVTAPSVVTVSVTAAKTNVDQVSTNVSVLVLRP